MERRLKAQDRTILTKKRLIQYLAFLAIHTGFPDMYCWLEGQRKNGAIIIAYHQIREQEDNFSCGIFRFPTRQEFEQQIIYLCEKYEIMSLPELTGRIGSQKTLPRRGAVITLDDGHKSIYTCVYPVLRKYHIPATVFLPTGYIGTDNLFWWDRVAHIMKNTTLTGFELEEAGEYSLTTASQRLKSERAITKRLKKLPEARKNQLIQRMESLAGNSLPAMRRPATLSWNQIEEMSRHDITFGAHTVTHPILTRIPVEQASHEIYQSKRDIEEHLNKPVTLFSYPMGEQGDFNEEIKRLLKDNGFASAVSFIRGVNTGETDLYELRRFSNVVSGLDVFRLSVSGLVPDFVSALLADKG